MPFQLIKLEHEFEITQHAQNKIIKHNQRVVAQLVARSCGDLEVMNYTIFL